MKKKKRIYIYRNAGSLMQEGYNKNKYIYIRLFTLYPHTFNVLYLLLILFYI